MYGLENWSNPIGFDAFSIAFAEFAPNTGGLYAFLSERNPWGSYEVIYIGQTNDLGRRLTEYLNGDNSCVTQNAKHLRYLIMNNSQERLLEEKKLIQFYQPKCNIEYK